MATSSRAAKELRRTVRRLAAQFIAQKITHAQYVAAVRGAGVTAGISDAARPSRDERTLNALAWGRGQMPPGELPARLEPHFRRFDSGDISADAFAREVRRLLHQFVTSPPPR